MLVLEGAIVTIDAMGCQTDIAQKIIDQGGDYVLNVKGNQQTLRDGIHEVFSEYLDGKPPENPVQSCDHTRRAHGRQEARWAYVCAAPKALPDRDRWPGLKAIGMVITNTSRDGKEGVDVRYYILSRKLSAKKFAKVVASHWSIGNQLHWQLDVTFREDHSRIRKGHADVNCRTLRKTALALLKNETTAKVGIKNKRLIAGWDDDYRMQVLVGA